MRGNNNIVCFSLDLVYSAYTNCRNENVDLFRYFQDLWLVLPGFDFAVFRSAGYVDLRFGGKFLVDL